MLMCTSTAGLNESSESSFRLERLSDADLLANTRQLVGRSNQLLAALLAHLAEVDARGIHRQRACASLYSYCVYELRLSEDAAFRRVRATKLARQFPVIFQQIADGELQLTTLLLVGPHLTDANHLELLALAKHRTKREVLRLVRCLAPEPSVPDRVVPLGPEGAGPGGMTLPKAPSWSQFTESYAPPVRELPPGERPKDWIDSSGAAATDTPLADTPLAGTTAPRAEAAALVPQRYRVEFTASQQYADLLERAQDLLSHAIPNRSLEEVHLRALRLLVDKLERRKYGAARKDVPNTAETSVPVPAMPAPAMPTPSKKRSRVPRQRESVTMAVRREVLDRDGACCSFVDDSGRRCRETRLLQLHHKHAHAWGGEDSAGNLTLYCQSHNALAAEQDFGRAFIKRQQERHRERALSRR